MEDDKLLKMLAVIHGDLQILAMVIARENVNVKKELNRVNKQSLEVFHGPTK